MKKKAVKEKKKNGRPSIFTQELAVQICKELALGKSLRTVCKGKGMPDLATVFRWIHDKDGFREQYARAKEESADALAEEIIDISDEAHRIVEKGHQKKAGAYAQVERLRIDTRKWVMAKMKPKKYGDKMDLTSDGEKLEPIQGVVVQIQK